MKRVVVLGLLIVILGAGALGAPAGTLPLLAPSSASAANECAGFADVTTGDLACVAIATLVANGIISGYGTNPPRFGPTDNVQRAQVAAFLIRALDWRAQPTGPRSFTDFGPLIGELRDASLILANRCDQAGGCVAKGYEAASCQSRGKVFPCFGPNDNVSHAQVISFVARALISDGRWVVQPGGASPYSGIPAVHQDDARTYHHYAGTIPAAPSGNAWNAPASRAWVARALFQALGLPPVVIPDTLYNDPQGRFSARIPSAWTQVQQGANNVYFRQPGPLWGAEIALSNKGGFTNIDQVDPVIEQQLNDWLKEYVPLSKSKVKIGPHDAYRRVFQHRNGEGQTEIIIRYYFLAGPYLYQVNGFMLPPQRGVVEPLVDGLAGSIATNP